MQYGGNCAKVEIIPLNSLSIRSENIGKFSPRGIPMINFFIVSTGYNLDKLCLVVFAFNIVEIETKV